MGKLFNSLYQRDKVSLSPLQSQFGNNYLLKSYNKMLDENTQLAQKKNNSELPASISADDVREVVQLLRRKPEGLIVSKSLLETHKRTFELKKILGFEKLKIIERENQIIKLSDLGWKFAGNLRTQTEMFRTLLINNEVYRSALLWINDKSDNLVNVDEISSFWKESDEKNKCAENLNEYKESAITFFHLCQAADLGTMTLGKKGRITRILVDREEIGKFLENSLKLKKKTKLQVNEDSEKYLPSIALEEEFFFLRKSAEVLIIGNKKNSLISQIETALSFANVTSNRFESDFQSNVNFDEQYYQAFDNSYIGCFILTENELEKDFGNQTLRLKNIVSYQIGAALFGFRSRIILLSTAPFELPQELTEIPSFIVKNNELSWELARKLVDKINEMKPNHNRKTAASFRYINL